MTTTPPPNRSARRRIDPPTVAWPVGLVLLLVALGTWRAAGHDPGGSRDAPAEAPPVARRTFRDATLEVPRSWHTLDRSEERITWGAADRAHTVTLASTEASSVPLPTIVREVVAQSTDALPGQAEADDPVAIDIDGYAPRGDSAVLVRFEVRDGGAPPIEVVQVWRRDLRAGVDLVATWTSADGTWPVSPRERLPQASSNG